MTSHTNREIGARVREAALHGTIAHIEIDHKPYLVTTTKNFPVIGNRNYFLRIDPSKVLADFGLETHMNENTGEQPEQEQWWVVEHQYGSFQVSQSRCNASEVRALSNVTGHYYSARVHTTRAAAIDAAIQAWQDAGLTKAPTVNPHGKRWQWFLRSNGEWYDDHEDAVYTNELSFRVYISDDERDAALAADAAFRQRWGDGK